MERERKNEIKFAALHSLIQASIVGIFADYAAWQHNPQMTIHDDGFVDIIYLVMIFASWLFFCFFISAIIYFCVFIIRSQYAETQKYGVLRNAAINSLLYFLIILILSLYFDFALFFVISFTGYAIFLGVLLAIKSFENKRKNN
jgi:hypothetical protein